MIKILFVAMLIGFGSISINQGYSQEIGLSTFQESAQGSGALACARSAHRLGGATPSSPLLSM